MSWNGCEGKGMFWVRSGMRNYPVSIQSPLTKASQKFPNDS